MNTLVKLSCVLFDCLLSIEFRNITFPLIRDVFREIPRWLLCLMRIRYGLLLAVFMMSMMILSSWRWVFISYYLISDNMLSMIIAWTRIPFELKFLLFHAPILSVYLIWGISCLRHSKSWLLELKDILVFWCCPPVDAVLKHCRRLFLWAPSFRPNSAAVSESGHLLNVNRLIRYRVLVDKVVATSHQLLVFKLVPLNSAT